MCQLTKGGQSKSPYILGTSRPRPQKLQSLLGVKSKAEYWKSALLSIMEQLDKEQYEKMLLHLETIPKGKKKVSRQQMVQKIIEFYGERKSINVVDDIMKKIPRNDRAVQDLLKPFVGKKKTGKKRKQEADPEPEERILQQKSAAGKKRKQEADPKGKARVLQQKPAAGVLNRGFSPLLRKGRWPPNSSSGRSDWPAEQTAHFLQSIFGIPASDSRRKVSRGLSDRRMCPTPNCVPMGVQHLSGSFSAGSSEKNQVVEDTSGKTEDPDYLKSPQPDKVTSSSTWRITIAEMKSGVDLGQKNVVGKVVEKSALRTYKTKDNEKRFFFYLGIADDSGCIRVMVYGKEKFSFFKKEGYYNFRNVIVEKEEIKNENNRKKMMKFTKRSNTSKAGKLDIPKDLELEAQMLVYGQRPVVPIEEIKRSEPRTRVSAEGKVTEIGDIEGKRKKKQEFKLEDTTDSIIIALWGEDIQHLRDVSVGDLVRVTNVTTNHYYKTVSLNSTDFTRIFKLQSTSYKDVQIEIIGIKSAGVQQTEVDAGINGQVNTFIVDSAVLAEALGIQQGSHFEERLLEKIPYSAKADIKGNTMLKISGLKEESKGPKAYSNSSIFQLFRSSVL